MSNVKDSIDINFDNDIHLSSSSDVIRDDSMDVRNVLSWYDS